MPKPAASQIAAITQTKNIAYLISTRAQSLIYRLIDFIWFCRISFAKFLFSLVIATKFLYNLCFYLI